MSRFVLMQGPYTLPAARHYRSAREWRVVVSEEETPSSPIGKMYHVKSFTRAVNLAASMASDRRLLLRIDARPR